MRIRTAIFLSNAVSAAAAAALFAILYFTMVSLVRERDLRAAFDAIDSSVAQSRGMSSDILKDIPRQADQLQAALVAEEIGNIIAESGDASIPAIQANPRIRRLAMRRILGLDGSTIGYFAMLTQDGLVVMHPFKDLEGVDISAWTSRFPTFAALFHKAVDTGHSEGYYEFIDEDERTVRKYMVSVRVAKTPYILAAVFELDKYMEPVNVRLASLADSIRSGTEKAIQAAVIPSPLHTMAAASALASIVLMASLAVSYVLSGYLSAPVAKVSEAVSRLGKGDFSVQVPLAGPDETQAMAAQFNTLGAELADHIEKLGEEIRRREAAEGELKAASLIQRGLIPSPESWAGLAPSLSIAAVLQPARGASRNSAAASTLQTVSLLTGLPSAKNVSGDFYDVFPLASGRVALLVADVSGKGAPAALFMAVTRTLVRAFCSARAEEDDPSAVLRWVNDMLCRENASCMFVTMLLFFLDPATGTAAFGNAGHHEAILLAPDGTPATFGLLGNPPVGLFPGVSYAGASATIPPGHTLVLFTDGATEATSPSGRMLGMEGVLAIFARHCALPVDAMVRAAARDILAFQEGVLADDLTILASRVPPA